MRTALIQRQTGHLFARQHIGEGIACIDSRISGVCAKAHDTIVSMLIGAIIGWVIGVAQLIFIGSWELFYWGFMPLIPFCSAFGWSLIAMIIGGSGLLSKQNNSLAENEAQPVHALDTAA